MKTVNFSLALLFCLFVLNGCHKKTVAAKMPPPPAATPEAAPSASLTASASSIHRGQSVELSWHTDHAAQVSLDGLGTVNPNGSHSVSPDVSTTYTLHASGPGGAVEATARVSVIVPEPVAKTSVLGPSMEELFARNVHDLFFDYDKYEMSPAQEAALRQAAKFFTDNPSVKMRIEGHCDERGSDEYNLALGDNRAQTARSELIKLGIPAERIQVISYGKEKPFCNEDTEQCWQQNRRDHFALSR